MDVGGDLDPIEVRDAWRRWADPDQVQVVGVHRGCQAVGEGQQQASRRGRIAHDGGRRRSEEHTSELQSLMRISYAVFCLKKKKKHTLDPTKNTTMYITLTKLR